MAEQPRSMADRMKATRTGQGNAITTPAINKEFEIKGPILHLINNQCQFSGDSKDDANEHLRTFKDICDLFKISDITDQAIKLRLFPWTLKGEARAWLDDLPEGTITTWDGLVERFLQKFFPASRAARLQADISQFRQKPLETLYEAWSRFSKMLRGCPNHGLDTFQKVQIFYKGCDVATRISIDQASGGSIMDKNEDQAYEIIEKQAAYSHEWHQDRDVTRSAPVASAGSFEDFGSISVKLDKFGRQMEKMEKDIHGMKVGCEFCGGLHLAKDCDAGLTMNEKQEVAYINQQNNNQFQGRAQFNRNFNNPYNPQGHQGSRFQPGSSGGFQQQAPGLFQKPQTEEKKSSLEAMMEKLVTSQTQLVTSVSQTNEKNEQIFRNQQASIQNLEKQIGNLSNLVSERKHGELPSNTKVNPRDANVNMVSFSSDETPRVDEMPPPRVEMVKPVVPPYRPPIPFPRQGVEYEQVENPNNYKHVCTQPDFAGKEERRELKREERRKEHMENYERKQEKKKAQEVKVARAVPVKVDHPEFPPKLGDPGEFIISCLLSDCVMYNGLADLGASLNVMPLSLFKRLGLPELEPTGICIRLFDQDKKHPVGVVDNVQVRVGNLNFFADFVVMDVEEDTDVPLILGRPFLNTARVLVDVVERKLTLRDGDKSVTFVNKKPKTPPTKTVESLKKIGVCHTELPTPTVVLDEAVKPKCGGVAVLPVSDLIPIIQYVDEKVDEPVVIDNRTKKLYKKVQGARIRKDLKLSDRLVDNLSPIGKANLFDFVQVAKEEDEWLESKVIGVERRVGSRGLSGDGAYAPGVS